MRLKLWIKYLSSPYIRDKCRISYLYSMLVDLDKYGNKALKRSYKKHRELFMEKLLKN